MRLLLFILVLLFERVSAQELKYLVQLKDKNNNGFNLSEPNSFLSKKSIGRRAKQNIAIDSTDLPITKAYIDSLLSVPSFRLLNKSKWFNLLLIGVTDTGELQKIRGFTFVLSADPVNNKVSKKIKEKISVFRTQQVTGVSTAENTNNNSGILSPYKYGSSYNQIHIHHGDFLHDQGFHGETMTVAILDDGFNNYLSNPAFETLRNEHRILGTYDFVNGKESVNEQELHGASCFSIIAANIPSVMIGSAPAANYWLFKTEDDHSETPVEEQNWAAAAEFADSVGADLITTSLGYGYFDDSAFNLRLADRNGHTALVTKAANLAVSKGMIVTASIGNNGNDVGEMKYAGCPADGDSVYAVGAVSSNGQIATFSSWGPNGSGQVKPDGVSVGSGTSLIGNDGNLYFGDGTSFSTPNVAGLIVCLWQAFPEFNCHDILAAVRQSSDRYRNPDERYGYGVPDFEKAYQSLLNKRLGASFQPTSSDWIRVSPVPFRKSVHIFFQPNSTGTAYIQLLDIKGKQIQTISTPITDGQIQHLEMNITTPLASGVYFIRYQDANRSKTIGVLKN